MFDIKITKHESSSKGNFFTVHGYKTKIMIECGITIQKIREYTNFKLSEYNGCLVSHLHLDHSKSCFDLASCGVDIYADKSVFEKFKHHHRFRRIKNRTFNIGEFAITPFDVEHDVPNKGFMIDSVLSGERIIFIIDTYYSEYKFDDVTHFIVEANHSADILKENIEKTENNYHLKRLWKSHMSIERCCDLLQSNDLSSVKEIHLTHLSASNGDGDAFKAKVAELTGKKVFI